MCQIGFKDGRWFEENYLKKYTAEEIAKSHNISIRKVVCRAYFLRKKGFRILKEKDLGRKKKFCVDCEKEINGYGTWIRCHSCSAKRVFQKRGGYINNHKGKKWNFKEIEFLKKNYATMTNFNLSKNLNRSIFSIAHKSNKLHLKKDKKFYIETLRKKGVLFTSKNNPVHNPKIKKKMVRVMKEYYKRNPDKLLNARLRRDKITNIEKKMMEILDNLNIRYDYNKYVKTKNTWRFPDFRVKGTDIVIECDGEFWHNKTKEKDKIRQQELEAVGFKFIRFKGEDILKNTKEVEKCIKQKLFQ